MPKKKKKQENRNALDRRFEFLSFLLKKEQRNEIIIFSLLFIGIYLIFRHAYPFPDTFEDTGDYVNCAWKKEINCYRPIGYSWVLNWFQFHSSSMQFVFTAQYMIHILATFTLLYTLKFFLPPVRKYMFRVLAACVILTPTTLYLSNTIMSDTIFISLSALWMASGIALMFRKNYPLLVFHLLFLFLLIQVRYTGLFYPLFTAIILFMRWGKAGKLLWITPFLVLALVIVGTRHSMEEKYGIPSFSAFSGWQLANNAQHLIPHIDADKVHFNDKECRSFHSLVLMQEAGVYPKKGITSSLMWDNNLAQKKLCKEVRIRGQMRRYCTAFIYSGNIYDKYGKRLILKHPFKYVRYFVLPNLKLMLYPNIELFGAYHKHKLVSPLTDFFHMEGIVVDAHWDFFVLYLAPLLAPGTLIVWVLLFLLAFIALLKRKEIKLDPSSGWILWTLLAFMIIYLGFHLVTAPVSLRYLSLIAPFKLAFAYILVNGWLRRTCLEAA